MKFFTAVCSLFNKDICALLSIFNIYIVYSQRKKQMAVRHQSGENCNCITVFFLKGRTSTMKRIVTVVAYLRHKEKVVRINLSDSIQINTVRHGTRLYSLCSTLRDVMFLSLACAAKFTFQTDNSSAYTLLLGDNITTNALVSS